MRKHKHKKMLKKTRWARPAHEDKLEFSRRFYNGNVRDYNIKLQTLPTSLIAGALGFKAFGFFQADDTDRAVPQVNFGNMPAPGQPSSLPPAAGPGGPPGPGSAGPPPPSRPKRSSPFTGRWRRRRR